MHRCFFKHRPAYAAPAALLLLALPAAAGPTISNLVQSGRLCPPAPVGDPQPAFDLYSKGDDQTMPKDGWFCPVGMFTTDRVPVGSGYRFLDEAGRGLVLLGIGGATPGDGSDYYSPRIVNLKNPLPPPPTLQFHLPGVELGRCLFPKGRNTWTITFKDDNTDATPDKFLTSKWETRGIPKGKVKEENVTFKADLDTNKLAAIKVDPKPSFRTLPEWILSDLVLADVGVDLSTLSISGVPSMVKEPADPGTASQTTQVGSEREWNLSFESESISTIPGQPVLFRGEVANLTDLDVTLSLSFLGENMAVGAGPGPLSLAPGASAQFEVSATLIADGPGGVAVLTQRLAGGDYFAADGAVVIPAPGGLLLLGLGVPAPRRRRGHA